MRNLYIFHFTVSYRFLRILSILPLGTHSPNRLISGKSSLWHIPSEPPDNFPTGSPPFTILTRGNFLLFRLFLFPADFSFSGISLPHKF
jgi:hypothetical protein